MSIVGHNMFNLGEPQHLIIWRDKEKGTRVLRVSFHKCLELMLFSCF